MVMYGYVISMRKIMNCWIRGPDFGQIHVHSLEADLVSSMGGTVPEAISWKALEALKHNGLRIGSRVKGNWGPHFLLKEMQIMESSHR